MDMNLVDFLMVHMSCASIDELNQKLNQRRRVARAKSVLKHTKLLTNHLRKNTEVKFDRLFYQPCYAFRSKFLNVSVEQYMYCKYKKRLSYPTLPCLGMRGRNGHYWLYPLEFIEVTNKHDQSALTAALENLDAAMENLDIEE